MGGAVQARAPPSDLVLKKSMVSAEPRRYRPRDAGTVVSKPRRSSEPVAVAVRSMLLLLVFFSFFSLPAGYDPKAREMATDYAGALAVLESSSLDGFQTICVCAHTDARFELHAMQMQKPVPMAT